MASEIVYGIENIDNSLWDKFVRNHPQGSAFQIPQMYRVFEATHNYKPFVVAAVDEKDAVLGVMQGVRICNGKGVLCRLSARVIVWGGPLVKDNNSAIFTALVEAFSNMVKRESVYAEIRNLHPADKETKNSLNTLRFGYHPHLNILVSLKDSEEVLFKKLASAKRRNVKKSVSKGLVFAEVKNEEELIVAYSILEGVYKNTEVPLSHYSLFKALFDTLVPANLCKFYKAIHAGEIVGVMVALIFNDRMYEWYVGSKSEFYPLRPNEFLVWNTMLAAKRENLNFFDFGGAGKPGTEYGVREFKKGFGGDTFETGRFRKVYKKLPWWLGNMAIRIMKTD
jgi:lipid II:glycine glycyltransferase (peptidoglycan interpeptide bridge formation enzyme)